eukprot:9468734-Pyramimonas_sp.AAC.2
MNPRTQIYRITAHIQGDPCWLRPPSPSPPSRLSRRRGPNRGPPSDRRSWRSSLAGWGGLRRRGLDYILEPTMPTFT